MIINNKGWNFLLIFIGNKGWKVKKNYVIWHHVDAKMYLLWTRIISSSEGKHLLFVLSQKLVLKAFVDQTAASAALIIYNVA